MFPNTSEKFFFFSSLKLCLINLELPEVLFMCTDVLGGILVVWKVKGGYFVSS